MQEISGYTGAKYHDDGIAALWAQVKEFDNEAMSRAWKRLILCNNEGCRLVLSGVAALITAEGKALREEKARRWESEWNREKGADASGRVGGSTRMPGEVRERLMEIYGRW
jgi:hypothetical protein